MKILRGSYDVITTFVWPPYEERVPYEVGQILKETIDQSAKLGTV